MVPFEWNYDSLASPHKSNKPLAAVRRFLINIPKAKTCAITNQKITATI